MALNISSPDASAQDFLFNWLAQLARDGRRCPTNDEINAALLAKGLRVMPYKSTTSHLKALCDRGMVRVEVSGRNWRTVTILEGQDAGRSTAPNPHGHGPYLIMDKQTRRVET